MSALAVLPAPRRLPATLDDAEEFDFSGLRIYAHVPDHRDFGIVALKGIVAVYDVKPLHSEGIVEGAFYVRESQRPACARDWQDWLRDEWNDRDRRAGPNAPLTVTREVVRAVRWSRSDRDTDNWAARLASGFTDGPYYDWWFGRDFIGKVVGIYQPEMN